MDTLRNAAQLSHKLLPRALILGERGCGKETFAKALHGMWYRNANAARLVTVNMGGVPPWSAGATLPLRLFGGHQNDKQPVAYGCVPNAWNGTLFMDELGDTNSDVQDTLLRLIQEGEYEPVLWIPDVWQAHCCFIGATNRDPTEVKRQDVIDRLSMHVIKLPNLAETLDDMPNWMRKIATEQNRSDDTLPAEFEFEPVAVNIAQTFSWPGNLRQLTHAIRRMQLRAREEARGKIPVDIVASEINRLRGQHAVIVSPGLSSLPEDAAQRLEFTLKAARALRAATGETVSKQDVVRFAARDSGEELTEHTLQKHFEKRFGRGSFQNTLAEIADLAGKVVARSGAASRNASVKTEIDTGREPPLQGTVSEGKDQ